MKINVVEKPKKVPAHTLKATDVFRVENIHGMVLRDDHNHYLPNDGDVYFVCLEAGIICSIHSDCEVIPVDAQMTVRV
ncbi:hypothetical protein [Pseudomonas phage vB_PaeP_SIIA-P2]|nr:hypothetical protein Pa223_007 [Pseudomonas virus Pa223]QIQ67248.1 hypothetical protein oldone_6 [Pseudomonas phage oldone]